MKDFNMEKWIDIKGYDGDYQVSNLGRVKSFKNCCRIIGVNNKPNGAGYKDIQLCKDGKVTHHRIHRLVAEHFCHKSNESYVVNYIDGDKLNNHYTNLEWVSASQNQLHAVKTGLRKTGGDLSFSKKVNQFDMSGQFLRSYSSVTEVEKDLGLCRHNIASCCRGILYSSFGFRWSYTKSVSHRAKANCLNCGKEYELTRSNKKHCSSSCRGVYNKKHKNYE